MSGLRRSARALLLVLAAGSAPCLAASVPPHVFPIANPVPSSGAMFGLSVAGLGDIDGDGAPDVAVGALGVEKVFLFSGATRALIRTIADPEGLSGNRFGLALCGAGDWNGDGVEDLAVGSPGSDLFVPVPCLDPNQPCVPAPAQGRVFVFSGATGAKLAKVLPPGTEFLAFGFALARMGDVNGDGREDLAVGSPTRGSGSFGQVFAFAGASGALLWVSAEAPHQSLASFGQWLASVDDVNGDGRRDLLVDAPFHDYDPSPNVYVLAGRVYVVSGASGAILRAIDNPSPSDGDLFGSGLTAISDETGDGIEEHAIGDPVQGKIFIHRGSDGAPIRAIPSPVAPSADRFGFPLARVEDRDGDGKRDVWSGASAGGRIDLVSPAGPRLATVADPTPGPSVGEGGFGWALASTGDLGGDGLRDLVAGEFSEPSGAAMNAGAAYLIINDRPPIARCQSVTRSADAACAAAVTAAEIDAGSSDPDGDPLTLELIPPGPFALGVTNVTLKVTDALGASDTCAATVTVVDTTAPSLTGVSASVPILWPADHRMVDETVDYTVSDNCSAASAVACALSAASSEPEDGAGDGNTVPDLLVLDAHRLRLRAERSGGGAGRSYTVGVSCTDAAGNGAAAGTVVTVPHDQGG